MYRPGRTFKGVKGQAYRVRQPSVCMFALNNSEWPDDLDSFTGAQQEWAPDSGLNWARLGMARMMLRQALEFAIGGGEGEQVDLEGLVRFLKQAYQQTDGSVNTAGFRTFNRFTYDVSLPEDVEYKQVSGGV